MPILNNPIFEHEERKSVITHENEIGDVETQGIIEDPMKFFGMEFAKKWPFGTFKIINSLLLLALAICAGFSYNANLSWSNFHNAFDFLHLFNNDGTWGLKTRTFFQNFVGFFIVSFLSIVVYWILRCWKLDATKHSLGCIAIWDIVFSSIAILVFFMAFASYGLMVASEWKWFYPKLTNSSITLAELTEFDVSSNKRWEYEDDACIDVICPKQEEIGRLGLLDDWRVNLLDAENKPLDKCRNCQDCTTSGYSVCVQPRHFDAERRQLITDEDHCECAHSGPNILMGMDAKNATEYHQQEHRPKHMNVKCKLLAGGNVPQPKVEPEMDLGDGLFRICYASTALRKLPTPNARNEKGSAEEGMQGHPVLVTVSQFWLADYWQMLRPRHLHLFYIFPVPRRDMCEGKAFMPTAQELMWLNAGKTRDQINHLGVPYMCKASLNIAMSGLEQEVHAESTAEKEKRKQQEGIEDEEEDYDGYNGADPNFPPEVQFERDVFFGAEKVRFYYELKVHRENLLEMGPAGGKLKFQSRLTNIISDTLDFDLEPEIYGNGMPRLSKRNPSRIDRVNIEHKIGDKMDLTKERMESRKKNIINRMAMDSSILVLLAILIPLNMFFIIRIYKLIIQSNLWLNLSEYSQFYKETKEIYKKYASFWPNGLFKFLFWSIPIFTLILDNGRSYGYNPFLFPFAMAIFFHWLYFIRLTRFRSLDDLEVSKSAVENVGKFRSLLKFDISMAFGAILFYNFFNGYYALNCVFLLHLIHLIYIFISYGTVLFNGSSIRFKLPQISINVNDIVVKGDENEAKTIGNDEENYGAKMAENVQLEEK